MELTFGPEEINWLTLGSATLLYVVAGALWYGPLFGHSWEKGTGLDQVDDAIKKRAMPRALLLTVLGAFLLAYSLRIVMAAFTPAYWHSGGAQLGWLDAWLAGFWTWLGYFVPMQLWRVGWELRSWRLAAIDTSFYFLVLPAMTILLGLWV